MILEEMGHSLLRAAVTGRRWKKVELGTGHHRRGSIFSGIVEDLQATLLRLPAMTDVSISTLLPYISRIDKPSGAE